MSETHKAMARRFFDAWSAGDVQAVYDLLAPEHLYHFPLMPEPINREVVP